MNPYQSTPGGGPPQIQFERSSCFPKVLLMLVVILGGGFYFFNEKISEIFNKMMDSGSPAARSRTVIPGSSNDDENEPNPTPKPTIEIMHDDPQIATDTTGDEIPEVLVHSRSQDRSGEFLTLINGKDGAVVWSVPEPQTTDDFAMRGDVMLAWKDDQLTALNLSNGELRWTVKLIDKIHGYPTPQIWSIGPNLVIVTVDNTLTVLDAKIGKQLQQRTLTATSPTEFHMLGESLCTTERIQNETTNADAIQCYNPTTLENGPTIKLGDTWSEDGVWMPDQTTSDGSGYRYLSSSNPPRIERFNADGSTAWQQELSEEKFYTIIPATSSIAFGDNRVAIVEGPNLAIVTPDNLFMIEAPEMMMTPLGFSGDILFVGEVRQRGTNKISITGYSVATGEKLWNAPDLGVVQSVGIDSTADWIVQPAGVIFTSYDNETDTEYAQLIKPDGTMGWKTDTTAFIASKPLVNAVGKNVLVSFSTGIQLLDSETGKVVWSYDRP